MTATTCLTTIQSRSYSSCNRTTSAKTLTTWCRMTLTVTTPTWKASLSLSRTCLIYRWLCSHMAQAKGPQLPTTTSLSFTRRTWPCSVELLCPPSTASRMAIRLTWLTLRTNRPQLIARTVAWLWKCGLRQKRPSKWRCRLQIMWATNLHYSRRLLSQLWLLSTRKCLYGVKTSTVNWESTLNSRLHLKLSLLSVVEPAGQTIFQCHARAASTLWSDKWHVVSTIQRF